MQFSADDERYMREALQLASLGQGAAEPNPMVGCVLVQQGQVIGRGYHAKYGGPHAERAALADCKGKDVRGATAYVTLEPCCHHGKTPPCTDALIAAQVARVVIAQQDPFGLVDGGGIDLLKKAGIAVEVGLLEAEAKRLNAPYHKLLALQRPWVIAKWAMTLDGKLATYAGHSRWISNELARERVHRLRGRMDAIVVGSHTALLDDPLLTVRPPGARTPLRIVVDGEASLSLTSKLVQTAHETPVLVAVKMDADAQRCEALRDAGCEVFPCAGSDHAARLDSLLLELGKRRLTNILVEGGAGLLGEFLKLGQIDEVFAFVAPKLIGGSGAPSPIGGAGWADMSEALQLTDVTIETLGDNVLMHGFAGKAT
ncbi:bifunctional diaminohydroxyphosphoribosylaminopyrimidine deaminase/5-amino-6-(5-phosphoribosylamino)uracil reductase RibD [Blastopirellula sp. JC732]|uniref:Riboflavin biosynthesis protein RibD n=1 Tax=Blastopirellula sediminis TaxID=2894196 RepID=A0A9X1SH94_9BACT|nr:bifunctional diaminohydroxyphosphoribosylaminopyrimidine deaminase/5-amino-6-(5-phosphoribosylamino)uracil reductase RibD [Blastopirellula sediminis]MCC9607146.1 bifunctional diaminohydroxyphosphoribosylaminopyrimidine deaminase/5-amino-6-(5-phosphoribosylamino)uracil reductase RibD [Blastopirellula sediminis]MCC9629561.1 bifunctional diaminohydroxyphosphoribosylaminopyrimidine deaminase/5-amino-6-(5-phosphoribosylamino)uracil reductase RibD [Blastopirellula sediminis]